MDCRTWVDTKILTFAVAILLQAGGIVWFVANLAGHVRHNDFQIQIMKPDIDEAIQFTKLWPSGKWGSGSLPSDVRQDLKIEALEKQVDKLTARIFEMNGHSK